MSKIISLEQAAKLIKDHDIVATTASSGLAGLPEELIVGIGNRYKEEAKSEKYYLYKWLRNRT